MAQKIQTILISDLTGDEIGEDKGDTIAFSYRGSSYTIDLSDKEAAGFDKSIAMYVEHATKLGKSSSSGSRTSRSSSGSGSDRSSADLAEIRAWAGKNGYEVSSRGRIKSEILEAYEAAQ